MILHRTATLPLAALGLLTLAPAGLAQQQVNSNGRALDANPQVGSGGTNRLENQVDYQARNNLITGNVAGGFRFQGGVNYTAPGAFRGALGSDDLFRFRAESLPSSTATVNLPESARYRGSNVSVYNNFTTVPQGNAYDQTNPSFVVPQGGDFRVNQDTFSPNQTLNLSSDPRFQPGSQQREPADTLGVVIQQDGTALSVSADPLTGVRRDRVNTRATPRLNPDGSLADPEGDAPVVPRSLDNETDDPQSRFEPSGSQVDSYVTPRTAGSGRQFTEGPADNAELARRNAATDPTGRVSPGLVLGQLAGRRADAAPRTVEQRVQSIERSIFGNRDPRPGSVDAGAGTSDQPEDAYQTLLETIRQQAEERPAGGESPAANNEGFDPRPAWMRALEEPTEQQLSEAEQRRQSILDRMRSGEAEPPETFGAGDAEPGATVDANERAKQDADAALSSLMSSLTYDVRLKTLAADREGQVNQLFQQAEEQMAAGKYLDAERSYRLVMVQAPESPLAQVGLIHAQLGSGLIRSAAFNLRSLFEEHPELIATRYGEKLLPPGERLEWLRGELQRMVDASSSSLDPGLMLAYLGHQVESRQLIRYGLAIAEEAAPRDPLTAVLRQIWLEGRSADAAPSSPAATPTPAPATPEADSPDDLLSK